GFASTIPRSTSSFSTPRNSSPTLSPACPSSNSLRNISTPVTTVFLSVPNPTISTSSCTFTFPRSIRPVATVPRPVIENTSSTGIRHGFSTSPFGTGMFLSSAANSSSTLPTHAVPRAVHVRVVPVRRGVLHVRRRNRQDLRRIPPSLRFRRLRHLVVRHVGREPFVRRHLRQRRRQRRLPVVHVPNGAHVHMRLGPLKLCLGHNPLKCAEELREGPSWRDTVEGLRTSSTPFLHVIPQRIPFTSPLLSFHFRHNLFRLRFRNFSVVTELHAVYRAALAHRAQRG